MNSSLNSLWLNVPIYLPDRAPADPRMLQACRARIAVLPVSRNLSDALDGDIRVKTDNLPVCIPPGRNLPGPVTEGTGRKGTAHKERRVRAVGKPAWHAALACCVPVTVSSADQGWISPKCKPTVRWSSNCFYGCWQNRVSGAARKGLL